MGVTVPYKYSKVEQKVLHKENQISYENFWWVHDSQIGLTEPICAHLEREVLAILRRFQATREESPSMAVPATAQPSMEVGQLSSQPQTQKTPNNPNPIQTYAHLLKSTAINALMQTIAILPLKSVELLHGEVVMKWNKQEVKQLIVQKGLQLVVLGKFSYGKPIISDYVK